MLPFLQQKKIISSVILSQRGKKDITVQLEIENGKKVDPELKRAAEDILRAVESRSPVTLAQTLQAFMKKRMLKSQPKPKRKKVS